MNSNNEILENKVREIADTSNNSSVKKSKKAR